jgi:hypothetical protein
MPLRIVSSEVAIPSHYGNERGVFGVLKRGAAFDLGNRSATNDSPANRPHVSSASVKQ